MTAARLVLALVAFIVAGAGAARADTKWTMVRTDTLTLIGDQSASTLRDVAVQLEQFRAVVGGLIHNADRPPALPTLVYVFGTKKAMEPYLPTAPNGKPAAVAGFFQRHPDVNTIVMTLEGFDESAAIAFHEYTHLLVGNAVRGVPVWLNEGLAEYYSTYKLTSGGKEAVIGTPPEGRLPLLRDQRIPLSDLIAVDRSSALYNEGSRRSIFYAESWAMVHYLLTEMQNGGAAINRFVTDYGEGRTPDQAFLSAFGSSPAEFDKQLREYTRRYSYAGTRFIFKEKLAVAAPEAPRVLSTSEADAWLGDLQRRLGKEVAAAPRIDGAVTAEPDNPATHLAAGLLRLAQTRTSEGLKELERAAALAPNDFFVQYVYGGWLLRTETGNDEATEAAALAALSRATTLKPDSSDAFAWLAYAQMQSSARLADARASIERAITLAPGQAEYRLRWADIQILQGGHAEARTLLTTLAAQRGDPRIADGAQQRLDRLTDYERRVALLRAQTSLNQPDASGRRGVEVPADAPPVRDEALRLALRDVGPNEQRVLGRLVGIDCQPRGVRFHVRSGDRTFVFSAAKMEDVDLIAYLGDPDFTVSCGSRATPEIVYLTWTPATAGAAGDGTAVAVEFLPKTFVP